MAEGSVMASSQCSLCFSADCNEVAHYQCENRDAWFCIDHGQVGGDRQVQDVGAVAYPSICDSCMEESRP